VAARRPRRLTLERSVEEAMRSRLAAAPGAPGHPNPNLDFFPGELDEAIDEALQVLQQRGRADKS
jgi:hypothetical protein